LDPEPPSPHPTKGWSVAKSFGYAQTGKDNANILQLSFEDINALIEMSLGTIDC